MIVGNDLGRLLSIFKTMKIPSSVKDYLKTKKMLSEEEKYKNVREAPRGKTKEEKTVEISFVDGGVKSESFILFDLSKGGMAITTKLKGDFEVDKKIQVLKVGDDRLDIPLKGVVRSINLMQQKSQLFKIGIQFFD